LSLVETAPKHIALDKKRELANRLVGDTKRCVALTNALFARGIDVQPILCPGVKERAMRLRFFINRAHSEDQISRAIEIIDEEWRRISAMAG
jgi:8-amino-7-oxononanoate synthase